MKHLNESSVKKLQLLLGRSQNCRQNEIEYFTCLKLLEICDTDFSEHDLIIHKRQN